MSVPIKNSANISKKLPKRKYEWEDNQSLETLELQLQSQTEVVSQISPLSGVKSAQQIRAHNLLSSDKEMKPSNGFKESELQQNIENARLYAEYLAKADEDLELNVSCSESDMDDSYLPSDFNAKCDFIYFDGLNQDSGMPQAWRGAKNVSI